MSVPCFDLQPRDLLILRGLFESRIMTLAHISTIYFEDRDESAKKRVQKLKAAGLLGERPRRVTEPSVLFLTRQALNLLREKGVLHDYPTIGKRTLEKRAHVSEQTLRHELDVMDVKAAFHRGLRGSKKYSLLEFTTWPLLCQFETTRSHGSDLLVKPDGFIRIDESESNGDGFEHAFFLEVDRSSEAPDTLLEKAAGYHSFFSSGGFAVRNGAPRAAFRDFPFRALFIFKNAERRNNVAERLVQNVPPILTLTPLSTFSEVTADPFGNIWITPAAYRDALRGTPYDTGERQPTWGYRRQSAREALVEERVKRISCLPEDDYAKAVSTNATKSGP